MLVNTLPAQNVDSIAFEEFDLSNGLHVILHENHTTPIVVVSVMYHVGSKNENPERTGFAHFFEHLLFEGTENVNRGDFIKIVQNSGGEVNANTSNDRTFYYEIFPSNYLETGLWLESERMLHAKVNHQGIETQRQVVKEERRQRYDNRPYGTIIEESMKRAFSEHPYRWTTIGSMDHLDAAQDEDYIAFYETFYVPNNAVLTITGDFTTSDVKPLIEKYFSSIPRGTKPITVPDDNEPPLTAEIRDTIYDHIQLPALIQLYRIPPYGTKDYYAVRMLSDILSNGGSSRLNLNLVDKQQIASYVGSFPLELEHSGVYIQFAIANLGVDITEVENSLNSEVERLRSELITEREFQKLQNIIESEEVNRKSKLLNIAEELSTGYLYLKNTNLINSEANQYKSISRIALREAARNYLSKNNRVTLYWLPGKNIISN